ncbi:C6 transcription factor [Fusarium sp. Ph1]|nr:C6 transcription factor [Fusarium sp. Ph1]
MVSTPTPQKEPRLACLVCRSRKVACDRQRPRCGLCAKHDFECQYKSRQYRLGLKAGYVSQLERQLEDVQNRLNKIETHLEKSSPMPFTDPFLSPSVHSNQSEPIQVDDSATIAETNEQAMPASDGSHAATLSARTTVDCQEGLPSRDFSLYAAANWSFATTRCVYACENLTAKVRRIEAIRLLDESPYLILCIFVAAHFYVTYSKALDADVPANLHTLAFTLHTCGSKWPLAISQCVLPVEFYDFRYSTLTIMDLLQDAAKRLSVP